jgi:hypothetical protein
MTSPEIAHVTEEIAAPIGRVWPLLADFGHIDRLYPREGVDPLPPMDRIVLEGKGVGAIRTLYLSTGDSARERLESFDDVKYSYSYSILAPALFGISGYLAVVQLTSLGASRTQVDYSSTGCPADPPLVVIRPQFEKLYRALLDGARRLST